MSTLDEVFLLYPQTYDRAPGTFLGPSFADREVPVPPAWVKEFVDVPQGCENACVARELESIYPPEARDTFVRYIKSWWEVREHGHHLVIGGTGGTYKRRQWAAAAVANEIAMRFGQQADLSISWCRPEGARHALNARKDSYEVYNQMYKRFMNSTLLLMLDPDRVAKGSDEWYLIEDIYMERGSKLLPTITSISDPLTEPNFGGVKTVLGRYIAETLQIYGHYTAVL